MTKYNNIKLSIIIPEIINNEEEIISKLIEQNDMLYTYEINGMTLVCSENISLEDANRYFNELLQYQSAIDEELSEEEKELRHKEVEQKWLNGNFNFW